MKDGFTLMTLTIDLPDEQTAALAATARAQGLSAEQYARQVLEHAIEAAAIQPEAAPSKDIEELFVPLRGLNLDFSRRSGAEVQYLLSPSGNSDILSQPALADGLQQSEYVEEIRFARPIRADQHIDGL